VLNVCWVFGVFPKDPFVQLRWEKKFGNCENQNGKNVLRVCWNWWWNCIEGVLELVVEKKFGNCEKSVRKKVTGMRVWHRITLFYTRMRINRNKSWHDSCTTAAPHVQHILTATNHGTIIAHVLHKHWHDYCTASAPVAHKHWHTSCTNHDTNIGTIIAHVQHMWCKYVVNVWWAIVLELCGAGRLSLTNTLP